MQGRNNVMRTEVKPRSRDHTSQLRFRHCPDLGAWPDCWVSMEVLHAPIPRNGSGSTTITTLTVAKQKLIDFVDCFEKHYHL